MVTDKEFDRVLNILDGLARAGMIQGEIIAKQQKEIETLSKKVDILNEQVIAITNDLVMMK